MAFTGLYIFLAVLILIFILLVIQMILICILFAGRKSGKEQKVLEKFADYDKRLDRNELSLKDEFGRNREEMNKSAKDAREELAGALKSFEERFAFNVRSFNELQREKFGELSLKQDNLLKNTHEIFEKVRESVEKKLAEIQNDNSQKLEKMRETVDEKLHRTLETRLGESFRIVSDRLELVQKGLGEMQSLAIGVGDLKKVLSNVKTRGVLGEYQLGGILEQLLTPDQYATNVKTRSGSSDMVEFAVKIPSKEDSSKFLWLPIDAKFPSEDYERLAAAYDAGNGEEADKHRRELERKIRQFAKDIKAKYLDPPATTDFALLFLPFEGLYAEVLRIPGLFDSVQREWRITITGPSTISAFLSSLQMGFRSLAVEKRTSEIWELLAKVRTEFGKFGDVLQKTKEKLDSASKEIENAGTRSRAIARTLRSMDSIGGPALDLLEEENE